MVLIKSRKWIILEKLGCRDMLTGELVKNAKIQMLEDRL